MKWIILILLFSLNCFAEENHDDYLTCGTYLIKGKFHLSSKQYASLEIFPETRRSTFLNFGQLNNLNFHAHNQRLVEAKIQVITPGRAQDATTTLQEITSGVSYHLVINSPFKLLEKNECQLFSLL